MHNIAFPPPFFPTSFLSRAQEVSICPNCNCHHILMYTFCGHLAPNDFRYSSHKFFVTIMFVLMLRGGRLPQLINQSTDSTQNCCQSLFPCYVFPHHRHLRQFKTSILSTRSIRNETWLLDTSACFTLPSHSTEIRLSRSSYGSVIIHVTVLDCYHVFITESVDGIRQR